MKPTFDEFIKKASDETLDCMIKQLLAEKERRENEKVQSD